MSSLGTLLIQIPRHALPCRALRRADIARRGLEDVLPRLPLQLDAARARARGAGSRPLRRSSGAAGGTPCAGSSATRRTRRNSGVAATPSRPRGAARIRSSSSFGLGFMPALSMADSTAKFSSLFCSASFMAKLSRCRGAFLRRASSCARSLDGSRACKSVVTSSAKPVRSKERAGVGLSFVRPLSGFAQSIFK